MALPSAPSAAPRTALSYITVGAILTIWSGVWMTQYPPSNSFMKVIVTGLLLTGIALLVIGFSIGWIGRSAKNADLPPDGAVTAARTAEPADANGPAARTVASPANANPSGGGAATPPVTVVQTGHGMGT